MSGSVERPSLAIVGLPSPVERDNRHVKEVSNATFYGMLCFLPVWICTVLPLSLAWQTLRLAKQLLLGKPTSHLPPLDSGIPVQAEDIILPLSKRKYDMVVLGVTGFTGRLAARHLAQKYGVNKKKDTVKWAMAGRSQAKLDRVKQELADELKLPELVQNVDTILVDTLDPATVQGLVKDTRVVATTAGPFQQYGNSVVEFCAKYGTHYVDITGEIRWVKAMMCQWNDVAKETGAKIVPFCGMDSIPWDLTVQVLRDLLQKHCQDDLQTVKVWDEVVANPPGGTIATACLYMDGKDIKPPARNIDLFLETPQGTESTHKFKINLPMFIDPFFDQRWTAPFVMASVNAKIVKWSHALQQKGAPVLTYREVQVHANFKTSFVEAMGLAIFGSLLMNPLTRYLALRFIAPSQGQGPALKVMEERNYLCVTAEGIGTNGNRAETVLYFKQDPGCLETARMMVESGLCLALDKGDYDKLPSKKLGGFWSPSAALGDVLLGRLVAAGAEMTSRVVSKSDEPDADTGKLKES